MNELLPLPKCFFYTPSSQRVEYLASMPAADRAVVFDLEDAVPPAEKDFARTSLETVFSTHSAYVRAVRINQLSSLQSASDLACIRRLKFKPDILIVGMVEHAEEARIIREWLKPSKISLFATIETPRSLMNMDGICQEFDGIIFGSGDLAANYACGITWENMLYARMEMVTAAAAHDIPALDTVCFSLNDPTVLEDECRRVRELGFYGKAAPHPSHIPVINRYFVPTDDAIARARKTIELSTEHAGRIFRMDGEMIGPPHVRGARELLRRADWNIVRAL
ncbi:hypothetical protein WM28_25045 [Burkholderia ubonensis]|uniref:HpcH/HpaI aldolase/citrate lyase family protein n=1 Tax=Burkholderia ubonensis TaxID=101571 RepID=UPI00075F79B3|nr:CoA ester lyase [Burkholderia ubonensis]KWO61998.1 hypothetical protein WM28_25045 [Burkholderia ubonensis]